MSDFWWEQFWLQVIGLGAVAAMVVGGLIALFLAKFK